MSAILTLVEQHAPKASLELLTLARRLGDPVAVARGPLGPEALEQLGRHGATAVHHWHTDLPERGDVAALLATLANRLEAGTVLVASSPEGKEIAARLAVRLDSGIITDAIDLEPGPNGPVVTQLVFAGSWRVRSRFRRGTAIVTVRPNSVQPEPVAASVTPAAQAVTAELPAPAGAVRTISRVSRAHAGRPDLTEATTVVTGGRGVGSEEAFEVIERLADAMGAAVGATRAVTDLEWRPRELQIGQTGKTVAPQLYLACGVSGAIQHLAGMQSSRVIVAINKDPKAPIFGVADFGVVGDLHSVVPALTNEIEKRGGSQP